MRSVDYEIKFTGCVHKTQNQAVYLIKQRVCWSAPCIVNKPYTTTAKKVFNILFSFPKASQLSRKVCTVLVQRC